MMGSGRISPFQAAGANPYQRDGEEWPAIDGAPHFLNDFPNRGESPHEPTLDRKRRVEIDWKASLLDSPDVAVRRAAEMDLNLDRANWHWLADVGTGARVLDIGAGMGTNSHALATYYREVVALEPGLEKIRFMRQRFAQEKLHNISVVQSSVLEMPFDKESFDLVVMDGLLERVADSRNGNPAECQKAALCEAFRLLRPGGRLYLGIDNRYYPRHFIGHPDPCCGLPFVTVLPRPLAHWYARRKGRDGYRNYLYSAFGYTRLLRKAGFQTIEIYAALPSHKAPRFFIPLDGKMFSYYMGAFVSPPSSRIRRLAQAVLLKCRLLQYGSHSFAIFASKTPRATISGRRVPGN